LVGEPYEAFLLPGGSLLVIQSLSTTAHAGLRNKTATELLRLARDHPPDAVHAMRCCFMPMRSRNTNSLAKGSFTKDWARGEIEFAWHINDAS